MGKAHTTTSPSPSPIKWSVPICYYWQDFQIQKNEVNLNKQINILNSQHITGLFPPGISYIGNSVVMKETIMKDVNLTIKLRTIAIMKSWKLTSKMIYIFKTLKLYVQMKSLIVTKWKQEVPDKSLEIGHLVKQDNFTIFTKC